ncbi:glycine--tRNA ligase subunit beta [Novosphingobium fuchskuhlense]|uniref:Glycine--tRNA ligase beta subunit n=1 Tax=Novosphingobium fuchskuhlense TaxID=1117702 RepID=A0A124JUQ6_9SPHN|nr:glycine--tRNA ligase subunit beta [Novosphingobium fuchskuhlense]KUR71477.1 glycine--tRNA ligase subunit beta [Novosphingobium fuchskuhlense]
MSSADFLLELRSEEIPARMQAGARADLEKLFRREMEAAGLAVGALTVWSTPRRLTLIARDLPLATEAVSEETKGPRTSAPEQALEGFLRKTGLSKDQLTQRDGVWFAVVEKPGRAAADVLAEAIPAIIRAFPWPKSQRWGAASLQPDSLRWVRPLSGIVALLGGEVVPCEIGGIHSGRTTMGHRFHHSGEIVIEGVDDYAAKLRDAYVIVDHAEREGIVREGAKQAAADAGLALVEDEGLVIENAGLTEWPVPLLGRFDEAFLEVPPEVIQLTARVNQKYFICRDSAGKLANAFVCTANIAAHDGGAMIVAGNRKVLAARLSDARFFWEQDRKTPLSVQAEKLARITFHEKLGTVADKVGRVAKLAEWLASEGIVPGCDPAQARLAAQLCKADLVTEMVGEFPELQGLMGGYYARAEGLPDAVADAIRDHYKPVGQSDEVPTAPVTVAVALADKLDTLAGFFAIDEKPTGSKDPFALRRAALGVIQILLAGRVRCNLTEVLRNAIASVFASVLERAVAGDVNFAIYIEKIGKVQPHPSLPSDEFAARIADFTSELGDFEIKLEPYSEIALEFLRSAPDVVGKTPAALLAFFADRLKVQQREAGVRHDLIDAVFALGGEDDLVRLLARVHALQAFVTTEDGVNLLAGYKRAANILKKEEYTPLAADYTREPAEQDLVDALDAAEPRAEAAVAAEDFTAAMAALAILRAPIDAFFESVTVNDADPAKRAGRLGLLDRFRAAVHKVADFGRIEG